MKLEWKDPESNEMSWNEAKALEKDGWRLPTRAELADAFDNKVEGFESDYNWSSSTYAQDVKSAWTVDLGGGGVNLYSKKNDFYVRLCRELKE